MKSSTERVSFPYFRRFNKPMRPNYGSRRRFCRAQGKRPYKEPFTKEKILSILDNLVENGSIDGNVVAVIAENYELIEETCVNAQEQARQTYDRVYQIT